MFYCGNTQGVQSPDGSSPVLNYVHPIDNGAYDDSYTGEQNWNQYQCTGSDKWYTPNHDSSKLLCGPPAQQ